MTNTIRRTFASFDRTQRGTGELAEPDRYRHLEALLASDGPLIARGSGLSYVAASFGSDVRSIGLRHFDRILAFDAERGTVEVEAGSSLGKLFEFLAARGRCLPVQPGHPQITVGGCIAGNVHGKNQYREGLFCDWVDSLVLWHPDAGELRLSRAGQADLFALTCGGFGLTGIIVSATLRTVPMPSLAALLSVETFGSAAEGVALLEAHAPEASLIYGWIDLAARARRGSGLLIQGQPVQEGTTAAHAFKPPRWKDLSQPSFMPLRFNRWTAPWINRIYRARVRLRAGRATDLFRFLYPTVGLERYYDLYGRRGFWEQQTLVPAATAGDFLKELQAIHRRSGVTIALATLKLFGGHAELLNFGGPGVSVAIDVKASPSAEAFLRELDALACAVGGRANVMKDSRISAETVRAQYGGAYDAFREQLRTFDPRRRFQSALSARLEL